MRQDLEFRKQNNLGGYNDEDGNYVPYTKDSDALKTLPYIPPHRLQFIKPKLGRPSRDQLREIRKLLGMKLNQPFRKCSSKSPTYVRKCEAKGDFSHSDEDHICEECSCKHVAGKGTRGDFYGLGPETGTIGVGFCRWCIEARRLRSTSVLQKARHDVELMQRYGAWLGNDKEYALKLQKYQQEEAKIQLEKVKARQQVEVIAAELNRVMDMLDAAKDDMAQRPTRYVKGELVPWSDMDIIEAKVELAKAISKLNLEELKMDESSYLHVTELTRRIPEMMSAVHQCLSKLEELLVAKLVKGEEIETDRPPQEYVRDLFEQRMKEIWHTVKTGRKQGK